MAIQGNFHHHFLRAARLRNNVLLNCETFISFLALRHKQSYHWLTQRYPRIFNAVKTFLASNQETKLKYFSAWLYYLQQLGKYSLSKFIQEMTALWCTSTVWLIAKLFPRAHQKRRNETLQSSSLPQARRLFMLLQKRPLQCHRWTEKVGLFFPLFRANNKCKWAVSFPKQSALLSTTLCLRST